MTELLTAAQMRAIEHAAIDAGDVTGLELMERAGHGVVDAIFAERPELAGPPAAGRVSASDDAEREASLSRSPRYRENQRNKAFRAVVLCGPGNNGGDGFVVARLLQKAGWAVEVFLYGDAGKLPADARVNYERWREMGDAAVINDDTPLNFDEYDLVVDSVFGIGLTRGFVVPVAVSAGFHGLLGNGFWRDGIVRKPFVVAIDNVSELDADSGRGLWVDGMWRGKMRAHLTVTFHRPKLGHYLHEGALRSGRLCTVDIGLPKIIDTDVHNPNLRRQDIVRMAHPKDDASLEPQITKSNYDPIDSAQHKFSHGNALILSGHMGKGGAARLAARGALRIGAGVVSVGCPPSALLEHAVQLTAVMTRKIADAQALTEALEDERINALCIGPGLGLGAREAELVGAAIPDNGSKRRVVFDADALTLISQSNDLMSSLNQSCVLTPHAGEFARLFPDFAEKLDAPAIKGPTYSKVDATREAAKRAGCVVLFKGPDTVIADPDGRCSINASVYERSAPWLATAGSGDVLAGFITGLMARGFDPMRAAETGAWLHTECALSFGPGLIAEDLPEELPKVFRKHGIT